MMKHLLTLGLCASFALVAGCSSENDASLTSVLGPREAPRSRVFQAEPRAVYEAARAAVDEMGYKFVHGGPAEGKLEALSGIMDGEENGSSQQISMKAHLSLAEPTGTLVEVSFSEIIESQSASTPGFATETPMKDTPLYEVFFRDVQKALDHPGKAP